jgi:hypothetical protein
MLCPYVWTPPLIIFCLVAPELLVVHIIFNNSLPVTEQEGLLQCLTEPFTCSSPEPDESSLHLHTLIQDKS